jgi:hypothetical protein
MWHRGVGIGVWLVVAITDTANAQAVRIGVDRRVELMAILFKLAGNPEYNQSNFEQYNADVARHFGPFRDHDAVSLARALRVSHGTGYSGVMSIAIRVSDPPELRERVPFDSVAGWPAPISEMQRFIEAARRFAEDSRADAFFGAHRALFDSANARLRRPVERAGAFDWVGRFFGVPPDRDFVVVPLLANSETNFGPCMRLQGGRLECYSILGHSRTDSAGFPVYDDGLVATLVHELSHGYANPLARAHRAAFERSAPRVYTAVAAAMRAQAYDRWTEMVDESLVHATVARYISTHKGEQQRRAFLRDERAASWLWVEELSDLFDGYEADRRTYPTLASFMPRVVAYFDSLPDRLPYMQQRYDAMRPTIVSLSIENGSDTVDPGLREIVVRLDRPVSDDGWSVVPALGPSGPIPGALERFPKITWKALDSTRAAFALGTALASAGTTVRLGVELEPGRVYELQLNTAHGHGFRSAPEGVPLSPYRIRFKTRGAGSTKR